jgi:hypothetical protein
MYSDGGGWKLYDERDRRAAKDHRCDECGRTIAKGETYRVCTGLSYDFDNWSTFRHCAHCRQAIRWLIAVCSGYMFEMVAEDLRNHVDGEEWYERTAPLTRLVRWQVSDWRTPNGDLRPVEDVAALVDRAIEASRRKGSVAA